MKSVVFQVRPQEHLRNVRKLKSLYHKSSNWTKEDFRNQLPSRDKFPPIVSWDMLNQQIEEDCLWKTLWKNQKAHLIYISARP